MQRSAPSMAVSASCSVAYGDLYRQLLYLSAGPSTRR